MKVTKKVIGLTGGIATGKSAVTSFLRSLNFLVIDADEVVHELQLPGNRLYNLILTEFGSDYFDENGQLNRKKLASLIFSNAKMKQKLGKLQNAVIREELWQRRQLAVSQNNLFFMDIPLLIEGNYEDFFDEIWLVSVPADVQLRRLMTRNLLTEAEASARIQSQLPLEEKAQHADVILDNSGSLEDLHLQILQEMIRLGQK